MAARIRVLIVDDSALIRSLLRELIEDAPDMEVVGVAPDPHVAREMIKALDPDVITLDVEMPRMNGIEFLEKLMRLRPTRVLMISTATRDGSEITMRALQLGAIDFISKPQLGIESGMRLLASALQEKLRLTAAAKLPAFRARRERVLHAYPAHLDSSESLLVIGASTGGTEAIATILASFPPNAPASVITQHMPPLFTASFARRLDRECRIAVREAVDGERALPGHAYIAPGDRHMRVVRAGSNYTIRLSDELPVNRHRPSVDVLFESAAKAAGQNAIGTILTGMGSDGAAGLGKMRRAGSFTIAQDEASSVIFGMPKVAIESGAATAVLSLDDIGATMLKAAGSRTLLYRT
ncbi:MAG TPA: chemotaxis response regulator protein-glutamate methylesterase [Candidatus Acidoferrales bacterium]|nr:chemotaxis response regulator protein-glutamate methylesterase [Candidatus Acidoferrales bacterium]